MYMHDTNYISVFIYVDKILLTNNNSDLINDFIKNLNNAFAIKDLGSISYFFGIVVIRNAEGMHMCKLVTLPICQIKPKW